MMHILAFRRPSLVVLHLALVVMANYLAFWIRFDGAIPDNQLGLFRDALPMLVLVRGVSFMPFGLYRGLWQYAGIWDLRNIIAAVLLGSMAVFLITHVVFGVVMYPRSVYVIDSMLLIMFVGGLRFARRIGRAARPHRSGRRVLIFGAGDAGETLVREMREKSHFGYQPVGFIDDDRQKVGQRIHGVPVLGTRARLAHVVASTHPEEVLIAIANADAKTLRSILQDLERFKLRVTTVPNLRDLVGGRVAISQVRDVALEDLLPRAPFGLDGRRVEELVGGRCIMVTGAGGSIGSELCRQIAALRPSKLLLFERYENSLYHVTNQLSDGGSSCRIVSIIGDIGDRARVDAILREHRPEVIFHAAAHKHVPLMEDNPCEAVKNNVRGTRVLAECAAGHGVERFVLISTDKAVQPSSVMGATKAIAELVVQAQQRSARTTTFLAVRFGNVLGSNGSVVPRFLAQIKQGGPVTVTHPDIRRYFMLIPEAVQLVLHSAAIANPRGVYILEMGDQIKLVDLAKHLIRLTGHIPGDEIPIDYVGLRPGEKLYEELSWDFEMVRPSGIANVNEAFRTQAPDFLRLLPEIERLEDVAQQGRDADVLLALQELFPSLKVDGAMTCSDEQVRETAAIALAAKRKLSGDRCPACREPALFRSRARTIVERVRRNLVSTKLHRCHKCGWRGWIPTPPDVQTSIVPVNLSRPDLEKVDHDIDVAWDKTQSVIH